MDNSIFSLALPARGFSLTDTLDCGQCFRFVLQEDGSMAGVAGVGRQAHYAVIRQQEDALLFFHTTPEDLPFWRNYLALDEDYSAYQAVLRKDPIINLACEYAGGIRILKQDGWEALCSFILSQNNHIPRIKGIIERLCQAFGEPLPNGYHAFPAPETLAALTLEELSVLRAGFRTKYLLDAAQKVAAGQLNLSNLSQLPLEEARIQLQTVHGVGPKVAECTLLYGFHRLDAFPLDVWMKRVMALYYPDGFPDFALPLAGVAQQYLFHYIRTCPAVNQE